MGAPSVPWPRHERRPPTPATGTYGASTPTKAPPGTLPSELIELLWQRPSWWAEAACRGKGVDAFFPERGQDVRPARAVCEGCPVRQECLDSALDNGDKFGVWGGLSERQRRKLRRWAA